jgi:protein disulfide-isomerase
MSLALGLWGCKSGSEMNIDWFQGGMEQALAQAKEQSRPLFVYWGAVWCPPCNVLKGTVFHDPAFVEATRSFVAVYLDGDTSEAQIWGEKLGASGYPTLLVLNPEGKEVARLQTGLGAAGLTAALSRTRESLAPMEERVRKILENPSSANAETWRSVAEYAWDQRTPTDNDVFAKPETFDRLDSLIPADLVVEKSRLFLTALDLKADPPSGKTVSATPPQRTAAAERFSQILDNPALVTANLRALAYGGIKDAAWLHPSDQTAKETLQKRVVEALEKTRALPDRTPLERLISWYPAVQSGHFDRQELTTEIKKALHHVEDEHSHSYLLNAGVGLLFEAKLWDDAERLLMDHLKSSPWPYYVMGSLSELYDNQNKAPQALEWAEKAYRSAQGHATRLQWGVDYLSALIKATPAEADRILEETRIFLESSLAETDAFHGRSRKRLERLSKELGKWAKETHAQARLLVLAKTFRDRCPPQGPCGPYFDSLK